MDQNGIAGEIQRHKAAIIRRAMSRPVRRAIDAGIFPLERSFFDYGCGHAEDINELQRLGYRSEGWDPYYRPEAPLQAADVVNLGYVINVIENEPERREALAKAWSLAQQVMIVSAQVLMGTGKEGYVAYGDGIVTRRKTFQKYYQQEELKHFIDTTLGVESIPVDLGVFFVFRNESEANNFRGSRFRSHMSTPRIIRKPKKFEDFQAILLPLMSFLTERGRLPLHGEFSAEAQIRKEIGSMNRAFQLILETTEKSDWDAITARRKEDLLVILSLAKFSKRPRFSQLTQVIQNDFRAFFSTYKNACSIADRMLFSLGLPGVIAESCKMSTIGKHLPEALYIHVSALNDLSPLLRVYEGCASRTFGRMADATLIKFHTHKPKISYLVYPDFDEDPHPPLSASMQVDLRDLRLHYNDYDDSENPPILHRKETFVTQNYPNFEMFAKLTLEEEELGLLAETQRIGNRIGWQSRLKQLRLELKGHSVHKLEDKEES